MNSKNGFRRLPPVCALIALLRGLSGRLRFERRYVGRVFVMEDGQRFRAFRHLTLRGSRAGTQASPSVLVVRFRFARLSQGLNRLLSLIPVPLIGGYPGFRHKLWLAQEKTRYWQGAYEFESTEAVEAYRSSFVLRAMNRRAEPESISYTVIEQTQLADCVNRWTEPSGPTGEAG
jgi:hypothetical protein